MPPINRFARAPGAQSPHCSVQRFVVDVTVRRDEKCRSITARGSNIHAFLAPFVCESAVHLLQGKFSRDGTHSRGAIFEAQEVLKRHRPDLSNSKLVSA